MDLAAKLPQMKDAALAVCARMPSAWSRPAQRRKRAAATALMPALEAELESRRAAKLAAAKTRRTVTKRGTKKA